MRPLTANDAPAAVQKEKIVGAENLVRNDANEGRRAANQQQGGNE
jgi:hypothetical protein